jgi:hypothetical protein
MSELSQYLSSVSSAARRRDGAGLARLLSLPAALVAHAPPHHGSEGKHTSPALGPKDNALVAACRGNSGLPSACSAALGGESGGLDAVVTQRLRAVVAGADADWSEANKSMLQMYNTVVNVFRESEGNWLIPLLSTASSDLRLLAARVSEASCLVIVFPMAIINACAYVLFFHTALFSPTRRLSIATVSSCETRFAT